MQSVAAYPLSRPMTTSAPPGRLWSYVRAFTLSIWMFTLVLQFWKISDWEAQQMQAREGSSIRTDFIIGFSICLAAHLTLGLSRLAAAPFQVMSTWSGRLFTTFCAITLVLAPMSLVPTTTGIYAIGTWAVYLLLFLYWQSDYRVVQRMVVVAGGILLAWLFILLLKHGLSLGFGSGIGGINRNTSASIGMAGMICCLTSPRKSIRWAAIAAGLFMALVVNSRGTLVATTIFLVVYYTCYKGTLRAAMHAAVGVLVLGAIMVAVPKLRGMLLESVLMLHDKSRGLDSGFTGRVESWKQALTSFWEKPIFGVGFRSTTHHGGGDYGQIHSGYLKILVETGFVGAFLVISAVMIECFRRFRLAIRFRDMPPQAAPTIDVAETTRINAVACGTLAMMLAFWVYEQTYINIGNAIAVVFFLMMVSPAYVTRQGTTIR